MPLPSETALVGRARALLQAMTERARWIYAIPPDLGAAHVRTILEANGLRCDEEDAAAGVARFTSSAQTATFVVFGSSELDVMFIEAAGPGVPPLLADVIDKTGFYAQSQLLRTALDVRDPESTKALRTLAHMVVAWDEDWNDLFLLHLASPDAVVRHDAALAVSVAAMVAREPLPAIRLLEEARRREKYPKLKETLSQAIQVIEAMTGGAVTLTPSGPPGAST